MRHLKYVFFILIMLAFSSSFALKEIALTIDDLPFVGSTKGKAGNLRREAKRFRRTLDALKALNVPSAGFVVAGSIEKGQWDLLKEYHDAGHVIANHTYSHPNLNRTPTLVYIKNIDRADKILSEYMTSPKYFRYPGLAAGNTAKKKAEVIAHLSKNDYVIAPVTIDSKDFKYNQRYLNINWRVRKNHLSSIKRQYLNFILHRTKKAEAQALKKYGRPVKQILLIHMNTLNSLVLPDIIKMFRDRGYKFITLKDALSDPAYQYQSRASVN